MELGTFGAILKFAMDIEKDVSRFYEIACSYVNDLKMMEKFQGFLKRGTKRYETLERVRRENVTEMILEPIVGLDSDNYRLSTEVPSSAGENEVLEMAKSLERVLFKFYSDAASKIDFIIEASYSLELLAEENEKAVQDLS